MTLRPHAPIPADWQATARSGGLRPGPALLDWLTFSGMLTRRIRESCPDRFRLQVLAPATDAEPGAMRRRVILWCGDRPCVFAQTDVPPATLAAHPWLAELGNESLGETLQHRQGVTRSPFQYALLEAATLPVELAGEVGAPLWARRSDFLVTELPLTVTEIFLSGIAGATPVRDVG